MWSLKKLCTRKWVTSPSVSYIKHTVIQVLSSLNLYIPSYVLSSRDKLTVIASYIWWLYKQPLAYIAFWFFYKSIETLVSSLLKCSSICLKSTLAASTSRRIVSFPTKQNEKHAWYIYLHGKYYLALRIAVTHSLLSNCIRIIPSFSQYLETLSQANHPKFAPLFV